MNILLAEWFAAARGSGSALGGEGMALLETMVLSFLAQGHRVTTLLHPSLEGVLPPGVEVMENGGPAAFPRLFSRQLASADGALILAPETGGRLAYYTGLIERAGKKNLGSTETGIRRAQDKDITAAVLQEVGIPTPKTVLAPDPRAVTDLVGEMGYPLVVKPRDGAGSHKVFLVAGEEELPGVLDNFPGGPVLLQEYLSGIPASVTILGGQEQAYALSLNTQHLSGTAPFRYRGGLVGWTHPRAKEALAVALRAWESIGGLRGFGGVDLVVSDQQVYVLEVNPRLTTPLCALAAAVEENLASLLLNCLEGKPVPSLKWRYPVKFTITDRGLCLEPCRVAGEEPEGGRQQ